MGKDYLIVVKIMFTQKKNFTFPYTNVLQLKFQVYLQTSHMVAFTFPEISTEYLKVLSLSIIFKLLLLGTKPVFFGSDFNLKSCLLNINRSLNRELILHQCHYCHFFPKSNFKVSIYSKPYIPILLTLCNNVSMKNVIKL